MEQEAQADRKANDPYSPNNVTADGSNLFPNLNAQNSSQEALNAMGATIPQPEQ